MALSAPYNGSANTLQANTEFIPKIWETELKKELDANFILSQASTMVNFKGKKGDTIKVPLIKRMGVFDKLPETQVRLQSFVGENWEMKVDKYKEVSFMIEDILDLQANFSLRVPYIEEAAYAMARDIDNSLLGLRASIPVTQQIVVSTTGTIAGDPTALDDNAIRAALQRLNEANVPQRNRYWIVSVGQYTDLLGITKFCSRDFVNGQPTTDGIIGTLYGIPVIQSTQITSNTLDGYINGEGGLGEPSPAVVGSPYLPTQDTPIGLVAGGLPRGKTGAEIASPFTTCMLVQKDWARYAMQKTPSSEMSRENMYQADVLVNTQVYGMRVYRPDHCVLIHTAP